MFAMIQPRFNLKSPTADKPTVIFMILRKNGQELKISTKVSVHPKYWNKKTQSVKKSCKESKYINGILHELESKVKKEMLSFRLVGKDWTFRELRYKLTGEETAQVKDRTFTGFFEQFIKSKVNVRTRTTIVSYQNALRTLCRFFDKTGYEDHLDAINMDFYNKLLGYLYAPPINSSLNNAGKIIKHIKTMMNEAVSQGATSNLVFKSRAFKKPAQKVNHIYLSLDEIRKVRKVDLDDPLEIKCRDILLLLCFTGLRFSDLPQVALANIHNLTAGKRILKVVTKKTGKMVVIPIHPLVQQILSEYQYVIPSIPNALFNNTIKLVAKAAGLNSTVQLLRSKAGKPTILSYPKYEVISSHIGRRSFITNMHLMHVDSHSIRMISGHQSLKEFENYIKVTLEENAKQLFESRFFSDGL